MRSPCPSCVRYNTLYCAADPDEDGGCCNYRGFTSAELEDYKDFGIHPLDDFEEIADE